MKNILVLICCLAPVIVLSQKTFISIGGELALPSSSGLKSVAGTGIGGSFRVESSWSNHIAGIATIGYLWFAKEDHFFNTSTSTTFKALSIQAGIKYYTREKKEIQKGFFISAELGAMPTTTHFDYETNPDLNFKETGISVAPGLGFMLGKIELSLRLQYNLTASGFNVYYYNFRLAYAFLKQKK